MTTLEFLDKAREKYPEAIGWKLYRNDQLSEVVLSDIRQDDILVADLFDEPSSYDELITMCANGSCVAVTPRMVANK